MPTMVDFCAPSSWGARLFDARLKGLARQRRDFYVVPDDDPSGADEPVKRTAPVPASIIDAHEQDGFLQARAYARWETRGRPQGDDWTDWLSAETEVQVEPGAAPAREPVARKP